MDQAVRTALSHASRSGCDRGRFAMTAEIVPPVSCDPDDLIDKARPLKGLADAVNVTDGAGANVHLSAVTAAALLVQATGSSRSCSSPAATAIGSRCRASSSPPPPAASAISSCSPETSPSAGDQPDAKAVFDLDSLGLMKTARTLRDRGELPSGRKVAGSRANSSSAPPTCRSTRRPAGVRTRWNARFTPVRSSCRPSSAWMPAWCAATPARLAEAGLDPVPADRDFAPALGALGRMDAQAPVRHHHSGFRRRAPGTGGRSRAPRGAASASSSCSELADIPGRGRRPHHGARQRRGRPGGDRAASEAGTRRAVSESILLASICCIHAQLSIVVPAERLKARRTMYPVLQFGSQID